MTEEVKTVEQSTTPQEPVTPAQEEVTPQEPVVTEQPNEEPAPVPVSVDQQEQIANFITELDVNIDEVDTYIEQHGELPESVMKLLIEKHGEAVAGMINGQVSQIFEMQKSETAASDKKMFDFVKEAFKDTTEQSGEETWNELKTWATQNLSEQKSEINSLLAEGGLAAELAMDYMIQKFRSSDVFTQDAKLLTGDQMVNDTAVAPLSREGYNTQLRELLGKGLSYESPEVVKLQQQRMKAMRRGQ